jgi:hypothetical protein
MDVASRRRTAMPLGGAALALTLIVPGTALAASPSPSPAALSDAPFLPLAGFVGTDELPTHGSAGFVLLDGAYHFIQAPGAEETSISAIDPETGIAHGWSRDLPADDPTGVEWSWKLDLATGTFTPIEIEGARWVVARGVAPDGRIVGKLSDDGGTPSDTADDASRGFIFDPATGETTKVAREGYDDIGFTAINADGVVTGFNDFGTLGFVWVGDQFVDLVHPDAYRLFPFQIDDSGTIVGFWGTDEETWYLNGQNPSFIARWVDGSYSVERYAIPGFSGTGLTALAEDGTIGGLVWETPESTPVVFLADDPSRLPELHPLPAHLSPFLTGVAEGGIGHGQVWLAEPQAVLPVSDADPAALAAAEALVAAVRPLSGPSHSGPLARILHDHIHQIEDAAIAVRDAVAANDLVAAEASLTQHEAALGKATEAVLASDQASSPDGEAVIATLESIAAAAGEARAALAAAVDA